MRFTKVAERERRTETALRREVDERRPRIWADVLNTLAAVQDAWPTAATGAVISHSLADFSVCGEVVTIVDGEDVDGWRALMRRLETAQGRFAVEEDPLVDLLRIALGTRGTLGPQPAAKLFETLSGEARSSGMPWTIKSPAAFTRALNARQKALEEALGAQIVLDANHKGGTYWVTITRNGEGRDGDESTKPSDFSEDVIRAFLETRPDHKADVGWIKDHCSARGVSPWVCDRTLQAMVPRVSEVEPGVWQLVSEVATEGAQPGEGGKGGRGGMDFPNSSLPVSVGASGS